MSKYSFSVSLSSGSSVYNDLQEGDIVSCRAEECNDVDPDAIAVYFNDVHAGYACNSPETIIPDTMSAKRLRKLIGSSKVRKTVAVLRREVPFTNRKGVVQRRFIAEAFFVPVRHETEQCLFTVSGLRAVHTKMTSVLEEIANGEKEQKAISIPVVVRAVTPPTDADIRPFVFRVGDGDTESCGEITDPQCAAMLKEASQLEGQIVGQSEPNRFTVSIDTSASRMHSLYDAIDAAVERCVGQSKDLERRASVMMDEHVSIPVIREIFNQMPAGKDGSVIEPETPYSQANGTNLSDLLSYMLLGKTVQLVGEKGSGKNTLVETACWLLNRPLCRVQGSAELDKLDILGSPSLKDGNTSFDLSAMLQTLRDDGVVVIDEANTVRPDVMVLLHSLTDNARSVNVPGYGYVNMGPHACIIYTLNEDYIGTGEMNAATIDRGPRIFVEQESDMASLLKKACPDASDENIATCVMVAAAMKKSVRESGTLTPEDLTVRGYIDALKVGRYIPLKRALIQNVANKAQNEVERTAMEEIIESFLV